MLTASAAGGSRSSSALSDSEGREGCGGSAIPALPQLSVPPAEPGDPGGPVSRLRGAEPAQALQPSPGAEQALSSEDPAQGPSPARQWGCPARCSAWEGPRGRWCPQCPVPQGIPSGTVGAGHWARALPNRCASTVAGVSGPCPCPRSPPCRASLAAPSEACGEVWGVHGARAAGRAALDSLPHTTRRARTAQAAPGSVLPRLPLWGRGEAPQGRRCRQGPAARWGAQGGRWGSGSGFPQATVPPRGKISGSCLSAHPEQAPPKSHDIAAGAAASLP